MTKARKMHRKVSISFDPELKMTEEHHKDEVEIHKIMRKYKETGVISHVNQYQGMYSDMIDAPDFTEAKRLIAEAESMFETVPSHIRDDFGNDPARFLQFMQNPNNVEQIQEYGLDTSHLPENPNFPTPPRPGRSAQVGNTTNETESTGEDE